MGGRTGVAPSARRDDTPVNATMQLLDGRAMLTSICFLGSHSTGVANCPRCMRVSFQGTLLPRSTLGIPVPMSLSPSWLSTELRPSTATLPPCAHGGSSGLQIHLFANTQSPPPEARPRVRADTRTKHDHRIAPEEWETWRQYNASSREPDSCSKWPAMYAMPLYTPHSTDARVASATTRGVRLSVAARRSTSVSVASQLPLASWQCAPLCLILSTQTNTYLRSQCVASWSCF